MELSNAIVITQARMGSSRLPGKVLLEIAGKSMIEYQIKRIQDAGLHLICAISDSSSDDILAKKLKDLNVECFRGNEKNVLSRFYDCAKQSSADIIVRITSDCPLIDAEIIRKSIEKYKKLANSKLYLSNVVNRTFPRGFDFEIFSFQMLADAFNNATLESEREHVTPYIRSNIPNKYVNFDVTLENNKSHIRLTVDEISDFHLIEKLICDYKCHTLSASEIIKVLENNADLLLLNQHVVQKNF